MRTVNEQCGQLKKSGQVTLDGDGQGVLIFDPDHSNQRWEVSSVTVKTNQSANATVVPICQLAVNTINAATMSDGNGRGASWSGNQDSFSGKLDIGPCDFLSVMFSPAPGTASVPTAPGAVTYPSLTNYPSMSLYPGSGSGSSGGGSILAGVIASAVVQGNKYTFRGYR